MDWKETIRLHIPIDTLDFDETGEAALRMVEGYALGDSRWKVEESGRDRVRLRFAKNDERQDPGAVMLARADSKASNLALVVQSDNPDSGTFLLDVILQVLSAFHGIDLRPSYEVLNQRKWRNGPC